MNQQELLNELTREKSLDDIQAYITKMNELRGFNKDALEQRMLLLVEELGEFTKAVRKEKNLTPIDRTKIQNFSSIEEEAADVFYVFVSVCEMLDINIYDVLIKKENVNINRVWD